MALRRRRAAASKPRRNPSKPAAAAAATTPRVRRVPKGRRPQYFSDPAIDKILWATLTLAQELSVTRDRLDTVERLLAEARVLKAGAVDRYVPSPAVEAAREVARQAYVARMLRAVEADADEAADGGTCTEDAALAAVTR
jgi:hypothetical protein